MHSDNEPLPENRNTTTRDIADAIAELIDAKMGLASMHAHLHVLADGEKAPPSWSKEVGALRDQIELLTRKIADGLKQHSGAKGVYT